MNKRLLLRLMRERISTLQSFAGYFFRADFEYVLQGVAFEYVPRGVYVWDFRFPLFDFFGPNLLYSLRILERGGFVGKGEMSEKEFIDFVLSTSEAQESFVHGAPANVPEFIRFLEASPGLLKNSHARLVYASALLLAGQDERASNILDELAPFLSGPDFENCTRLRTAIQQGASRGRALLDLVRQENLRALGL